MKTLFIILFTLILLLICILILNLINITKRKNYSKTISSFSNYFIFIYISLLSLYLVTFAISFRNLNQFIPIFVAKIVISAFYFVSIYSSSRILLKNLKNEIIFDEINVIEIQKIGSNFIYLAITEIIIGIILGVLLLISGFLNSFTFKTNSSIFLCIGIGFILLIISFILRKAIDIDTENKLTI